MPSRGQALSKTIDENDLSELADYVKGCEVTKMNLQSCEGKFYKLNEERQQESFWNSTTGEIAKFMIYFSLGAITIKSLDD